jgi:tetratricopeptide (TPR) repeat protein
MHTIGKLPEEVVEHGLVVIAGAGVSMLPPTALPSWRDFNRAVLEALFERVGRDTNREFVSKKLTTVLARRENERAFAPDFMAQLMEEEVGADYFRVLQALDTDRCNRNHLIIASLARSGHIRAIVTTNFDRLLEHALNHSKTPFRLFAAIEEFAQLPEALAHPDVLPVIKAHGTVERPDSMVDTLAQRVCGRPETLNSAIRMLLERHACLTLGFSGADLDYDPHYLGLRSAAGSARSLTVLIRLGEAPLDAMRRLVQDFGDRGRALEGSLPNFLIELAAALNVEIPDVASTEPAADLRGQLEAHTRSWVDALGSMPAINIFIALVDANGDDPWMLDFMLYFRRYYRTEEHTVDPWAGTPSYWRYEYQFGRRLLDRGRHRPDQHGLDDGQRLLSSKVIRFNRYEDAANFLGNAAMRGKLPEAEAALSELTFWMYGPGRGVAHAKQTWARLAESLEKSGFDEKDYRRATHTMIAISRVFEWSGEYKLALMASEAGITDAGRLGDEPRRALALIQFGRGLSCSKQHDAAEKELAEAGKIADRLSLIFLQTDVRAAKGMLDVLRSRDANAIDPLTMACSAYRREERLPALFITLLDLVRGAFYAGRQDLLHDGQIELHSLCDLFPRVEGLVCLLQLEMSHYNKEWDTVKTLTDQLEHFATIDSEYPWKWGLGRVAQYRELLLATRA